MLPTKGLTLPFLSYGGSSLLCLCFLFGLLLSLENAIEGTPFAARFRRLKKV
ncbi:MAG TPA: FtsW/RodA/SpoVE family cell cycle protein [Pseudobdellovibrionaceae bacterium]|nr:FtsW/RodA/SpoVE family cell cycle protein [Pseudobdellovibrionaceae bacterium]